MTEVEKGFDWRWLAGSAATAIVVAVIVTALFVDRSPPAKFVGGWIESKVAPVASGNARDIPALMPGITGRVCRVIEWSRPADAHVTGSLIDECGTDHKMVPFDTGPPETMGPKPPRCRDLDVPELKNGEVRYIANVSFRAAPLDYLMPIDVRAPVVTFRLIGSRKNAC